MSNYLDIYGECIGEKWGLSWGDHCQSPQRGEGLEWDPAGRENGTTQYMCVRGWGDRNSRTCWWIECWMWGLREKNQAMVTERWAVGREREVKVAVTACDMDTWEWTRQKRKPEFTVDVKAVRGRLCVWSWQSTIVCPFKKFELLISGRDFAKHATNP